MSQAYLPVALRRRIIESSRHRCGYCLSSQLNDGQRYHFEHLIPLSAGGTTIEQNLWLACPRCNLHKGTQTDGLDLATGLRVPLFNPREQVWQEHFVWGEDGTHIVGLTPIGRVTVSALCLNDDLALIARRRWVKAGWHPPTD
jgi:hypothetical protein